MQGPGSQLANVRNEHTNKGLKRPEKGKTVKCGIFNLFDSDSFSMRMKTLPAARLMFYDKSLRTVALSSVLIS